MEFQRLPITDLHPAPYNPRVVLKPGDAAYEKLKRSLDEFDLVQPIVWNRQTGHVVGGHQRLQVLKDQGRTAVDCVVVDLSLEREKALNITLNNAAVSSEWDPDKLLDLLEGLHELPEFDETLTGFDEQQFQDLLLAPVAPGASGWTQLDDDDLCDAIRATLEVPEDRWESTRERIDELLATEPSVSLHVKLPKS